MTEVTGAMVAEEARKWIGVPYRHQGRSVIGIDCAGLIVEVGTSLNILDPSADFTDYPRRPDGGFVNVFRKHLNFVTPVRRIQEGDVLVFAARVTACHSGIAALVDGSMGVIHAYAIVRKVQEETFEDAKEVIGTPKYVFRYHGVPQAD